MRPSITLGVGLGDFSIDRSADSEWLGTTMDEVAEIPKWGFLGGIILRLSMIFGVVQPSGFGSCSGKAFNSESTVPMG